MKPSEYKTLIQNKYQEITKYELQLTPDQFNMFAHTAITFKSGETILNMWGKYLKDGSTDIQGFFEYCVDVYLEDGER